MVAAAGGREADELAQDEERHQTEQHDGHAFAQDPADPEHQRHHPRAAQQRLVVPQPEGARGLGLVVARAAFAQRQQHAHTADDEQQAKQQHEHQADLLIGAEAAQERRHPRALRDMNPG